ncbi:MAG: hypothetical protein LBT05_03720 [Planctomycetaceae bacterium]|jgi:hypothetical protein|nr:hypothetical protein [Planctomycetaceae bacterium]
MSPNAQGYVNGSVTELLLKQHLERLGYEVKRIRENWEGKKHPNHHGDFYFRKKGTHHWFVLESKGVKSNTEDWNKLYNLHQLKKILFDHNEIIYWIDKTQDIEPQINKWIETNLPDLRKAPKLYKYEEIRDYLSNPPKKETSKFREIKALSDYTRDQIDTIIDNQLKYIMSKIMVLDTHFVSGISGSSERTQATPRKDEFNIISIDIALRYDDHKFLFANPKQLEASGKDCNHLQQNYIMGFAFPQTDGSLKLDLTDEWYDKFDDVFETLTENNAVKESDMQIDNRNVIVEDESL